MASAAAPAAMPQLERVFVAADCSVKAVYGDNTVLALSADGTSFAHVAPCGARTVQLAEYALSRFSPLLAQLLDFRNQHVDAPAPARPLRSQLAAAGLAFELGYPVTQLHWPASAEEAFARGLVELPDAQRVAVRSRCGSGRVMVEFAGLRFAVRYPLLLQRSAAGAYVHTWHTQVFSRSQYPARWAPALAVASAVADTAAAGFRLPPEPPLQAPLQQQQQLADVTNRGPGSPQRAAGAACGSPQRAYTSPGGRRYGSPLQRQHRGWRQLEEGQRQPWQRAAGGPQPASLDGHGRLRSASPRRQGPQLLAPLAAVAGLAAAAQGSLVRDLGGGGGGSSSSYTTQLPISAELVPELPEFLQQAQREAAGGGGSRGGGGSIAAALSQALGQRAGGAGAAGPSAGLGRGWWLEPSLLLPSDEVLQIVWTREATMLFIQGTEEVEVWLHADDSCLYSFQSGAFVTHLLPSAPAAGWGSGAAPAAPAAAAGPGGGDADGLLQGGVDPCEMSRVYAASSLPEMAVAAAAGGCAVKVQIGQVAAQALRFRSAMVRVKRSLAAAAVAAAAGSTAAAAAAPERARRLPPAAGDSAAWPDPAAQEAAGEEQDVPGVGRFTAAADGTVRVVFADRTLLRLDPDRSSARLVMADGTRRHVPTQNPVGAEAYVQAALEFAAWSSTTPEQRAASLWMQALVAAELRSSARMAAICEWGGAQRLPPQAVAEPRGSGSCPLAAAAVAAEPAGPGERGRAVEELLEANARLLRRLAG